MSFPLIRMAHKRKITTKVTTEEDHADVDGLYDPRDIPVRYRKDPGWKQWVTQEYAMYWYLLAAMFLDLFLLLEAYTHHWGELLGTVTVIGVIGIVLLEVWGYFRLWGKNGKWKKR